MKVQIFLIYNYSEGVNLNIYKMHLIGSLKSQQFLIYLATAQ